MSANSTSACPGSRCRRRRRGAHVGRRAGGRAGGTARVIAGVIGKRGSRGKRLFSGFEQPVLVATRWYETAVFAHARRGPCGFAGSLERGRWFGPAPVQTLVGRSAPPTGLQRGSGQRKPSPPAAGLP